MNGDCVTGVAVLAPGDGARREENLEDVEERQGPGARVGFLGGFQAVELLLKARYRAGIVQIANNGDRLRQVEARVGIAAELPVDRCQSCANLAADVAKVLQRLVEVLQVAVELVLELCPAFGRTGIDIKRREEILHGLEDALEATPCDDKLVTSHRRSSGIEASVSRSGATASVIAAL